MSGQCLILWDIFMVCLIVGSSLTKTLLLMFVDPASWIGSARNALPTELILVIPLKVFIAKGFPRFPIRKC